MLKDQGADSIDPDLLGILTKPSIAATGFWRSPSGEAALYFTLKACVA